MTDYEKGMQKSMQQSLKIPHFYLMEEIEITKLKEMR
jgi:pyruvate/2-oxoglutarate dehydrogenase complex dihydrolipoamide acyltransferase (E2) component